MVKCVLARTVHISIHPLLPLACNPTTSLPWLDAQTRDSHHDATTCN